MTDAPVAEYVVLSEGEAMHFVVVRWPTEGLLRVVAAFQNKDRAESYAELENMWFQDREDFKDLPTVTDTYLPKLTPMEPLSAVTRLMHPTRIGLPAPPEELKQAKAPRVEKALKELRPAPPVRITREPRQAKALRVVWAGKEIKPEPQKTAVTQVVIEPARLVPHDEPAHRHPGKGHPADYTARDDKLRELWATDLPLQQIADKLGLHFTTVSQRAKFLGLPSRKGRRVKRAAPADDAGFDPSYYAKHAIIPDRDQPPLAADITAALMGDPSHGASVGVERAGPQRDGGGAI